MGLVGPLTPRSTRDRILATAEHVIRRFGPAKATLMLDSHERFKSLGGR